MKLAYLLTPALLVFASAAGAEPADFPALDSDGSGGLSLAEIQAVDPDATAADLSAYDADASGELSASEYGVYVMQKLPIPEDD